MAISFQNIPTTIRTPGVFAEVDNSRALQGLAQYPHKVIILGQKETAGTASREQVYGVSNEIVADGYFGVGSPLARMCRMFKHNNPNTQLFAMALSETGTARASGVITFTGSATANGTFFLLVGGSAVNVACNSGWSQADVASAVASAIQADLGLCVIASLVTSTVILKANGSGVLGNYYNVRVNYYDGQSNPKGIAPTITALAGGTGSPTIGGAWAVLTDEQYNHVIQAYTEAADLASLETELDTRYGPQVALQGFGYTALRGTLASCATLGLTRNSPHNCIVGANNSPSGPDMWAAAMGAVCAAAMEDDPGRPVHTLKLKGILPPPAASRFTRAERNTLLYDGISTWTVDAGGNVILERVITTYRVNALNSPDPSYLDINTMFLIMAIRYQYGLRMSNRFIVPRFKLADDTFLVQPGALVATPKTIKSEIIALFQELYEMGYIENIEEFIKNLVVERDATDTNRVNTLLAPDLINQFRLLAGKLQFIL